MLQQTREYRYLFEILILILLDIYPRVGLLKSDVVSIFNFLSNFPTTFHNGCIILKSHQQHTFYFNIKFAFCLHRHCLSMEFIYSSVLSQRKLKIILHPQDQ